jgi:predicted permease
MNIAYRVFLYSYAYVAISSLKSNDPVVNADGTVSEVKTEKQSFGQLMKKVFLNPIVIATLAGLILWLLQAIPGVAVVRTDWLSTNTAEKYVAIWRFDVTLPWIYQAANTLGGLSSTVILFAIGCTLGATNIKEAATDKFAWIWTAIKVIVAPAIVLGILFLIQAISKTVVADGIISIDTVRSSLLTWMVPPATVAVGYCIAFDQEKEMASHISLLSTFGAVVGIVIWVIILTIVETSGFFATIA